MTNSMTATDPLAKLAAVMAGCPQQTENEVRVCQVCWDAAAGPIEHSGETCHGTGRVTKYPRLRRKCNLRHWHLEGTLTKPAGETYEVTHELAGCLGYTLDGSLEALVGAIQEEGLQMEMRSTWVKVWKLGHHRIRKPGIHFTPDTVTDALLAALSAAEGI